MKHPRALLPALALTAAAALVTGCSVQDGAATTPAAPAGQAATTEAATQDETDGLTLLEGWTKATEDPMTGVFGTLRNSTDEDIHLVGVESEIAGMAELHVTVDDGAGGRMMQEAEDGFVIPAGGEHVLEPGGHHLMLMRLTAPIATGEDVDLTMVDSEGREYPVTVTARAFTGAEEHYAPGHGGTDDEATSEAP